MRNQRHGLADLMAKTDVDQVDKATLAYASLLGIFEDTHINQTDYNNLNTLFYVGLLSTSNISLASLFVFHTAHIPQDISSHRPPATI
jgi:hypothetical protein